MVKFKFKFTFSIIPLRDYISIASTKVTSEQKGFFQPDLNRDANYKWGSLPFDLPAVFSHFLSCDSSDVMDNNVPSYFA